MGCNPPSQENVYLMKRPKDIREELMSVFLSVEELYSETPSTETEKLSYIEIELIEQLLNSIKDIMYHYQEDVPEMRVKRKWGEEMKRAEKLLKKYSDNLSGRLKLKEEFDDSGYLENREFFSEASINRPHLKKKIM